jgi:hypothetical protein
MHMPSVPGNRVRGRANSAAKKRIKRVESTRRIIRGMLLGDPAVEDLLEREA